MGSIPDVAEADGGPVEFCSSQFHVFEQNMLRDPDRPALIVAHQPSTHLWALASNGRDSPSRDFDCLSWSYAHVHRAACRIAAAMHAKGVDFSNTGTVCLLPNGVEWPTLAWTGKIAKTTFSPLDYTSLQPTRASELQAMLSATNPGAIFVADNTAAQSADLALAAVGCSPKVRVIISDNSSCPGWISILDLARGFDVDSPGMDRILQEAREDDGNRVDSIIFTSGTTTGKPKGCPRTAKACAMYMKQQSFGDPADQNKRSMLVSQNFRTIAPVQLTNAWYSGGALVIPSQVFNPGKYLEAIARFKATNLLLLPTLLHMVVAHPAFRTTDISSVQSLLLGGDMVVAKLYQKAAKAFPNANIRNTHGMTEGGAAIDWPFHGPGAQDVPCYGEILTLGVVQSGAVVKIADDDNNPVKRGELGELHFCSDVFIRRYVHDVQPHLFYRDARGRYWFKTGDTAMIDAEGHIFVLGRTKDIIKRAALSVVPAALESCLNAFCDTESSVVGIPHPLFGQEPFAVLQSMGGKSEHQVKQMIVDSFGKDYAIGGVLTLEELGLQSFPVNLTGKIVKRDLAEVVQEKLKQ